MSDFFAAVAVIDAKVLYWLATETYMFSPGLGIHDRRSNLVKVPYFGYSTKTMQTMNNYCTCVRPALLRKGSIVQMIHCTFHPNSFDIGEWFWLGLKRFHFIQTWTNIIQHRPTRCSNGCSASDDRCWMKLDEDIEIMFIRPKKTNLYFSENDKC